MYRKKIQLTKTVNNELSFTINLYVYYNYKFQLVVVINIQVWCQVLID